MRMQFQESSSANSYLIWPAPADKGDLNTAVRPALEAIMKSGGDIREVREAHLLDGLVLLPFLETPSGERFYGVASIRRFAKDRTK